MASWHINYRENWLGWLLTFLGLKNVTKFWWYQLASPTSTTRKPGQYLCKVGQICDFQFNLPWQKPYISQGHIAKKRLSTTQGWFNELIICCRFFFHSDDINLCGQFDINPYRLYPSSHLVKLFWNLNMWRIQFQRTCYYGCLSISQCMCYECPSNNAKHILKFEGELLL